MSEQSSSSIEPGAPHRRSPLGPSPLITLLVVVVVIGLIIGSLALVIGHHATNKSKPTHAATTKVITKLGPEGVTSSAIIAENKLPGTTAWQINGTMTPHVIEGFANTTDVSPGQTVGFYISSQAPSFTITAYRMGYYQGKGARQVWTSKSLPGVVQPACPLTPKINMVSCDNWAQTTSLEISKIFVPGYYLFKLTSSTNQQSYIPLTISDPTSHSTYVLIGRSMTEAGWNTYGGYSFYQGLGTCAPTYPVCNRARVASFDRPFDTGNGASDFLGNEYPLVQYVEKEGLDVSYLSDVTLSVDPTLAMNHTALLSLGHDETWTYEERQGVLAAMNKGLNVVYFGAAAVLRHARLQASPLGPDQEVVNYRSTTEDPMSATGPASQITGNTFNVPPTNLSPTLMTGELYSGFLIPGTPAVPLVVSDATSWLYTGTGLVNGSQIPGVIDSDIDHRDPGADSPANLQILAHSPVPLSQMVTNQGKWGAYTYADTTYWTSTTSDAGVFDAGTVNWIYAMQNCAAGQSCPGPLMQKMTGNILHLFGQGPTGKISPAVSNTASILPLGS